jgi:uncharacterized membrane protein YgcG
MPFRLLAVGLASVAMLAFAGSASALGPLPGPGPTISPISASYVPGQTVTCSPGTWFPSPTQPYAFTWQRDAANIAGQTGSQYTLATDDVNNAVTCTVVATDDMGSTSAISPPIVPVALPGASAPVGLPGAVIPVEQALPAISGTAAAGKTVSCSSGGWTNNPTSYSYTWQRDGLNIAGQTGSQYTLATSDVNNAITCTVVAHNSSGDSLPAISLPIIPSSGSGTGAGSGGSGSGGTGSGGTGGSGGSGGGSGSHGGTKLFAPTIKSFSVAPGRVTVLVKGKRQSTKGATFRYTLDEKAAVLIALEQRQTGRLKGKQCVGATRRNAKAKHCTRWVAVKLLSVKSAKAGTDQLKYAGWIGKRLLASGRYRAIIAGVNNAGWSKTKSANFAVVRQHSRSRAGRHR